MKRFIIDIGDPIGKTPEGPPTITNIRAHTETHIQAQIDTHAHIHTDTNAGPHTLSLCWERERGCIPDHGLQTFHDWVPMPPAPNFKSPRNHSLDNALALMKICSGI